jgi:hypothetical protein
LIWRYCKMFFTESAARGLIDVIDVIDHAWRPIEIDAHSADSMQLASCEVRLSDGRGDTYAVERCNQR